MNDTQADLFGEIIPFSMIAGLAGGDHVCPVIRPATRDGHNVVNGEAIGTFEGTAVLASIAVPQQDVLSTEWYGPVRDADISAEADNLG
jgi:hypothetical protein